MTGLAINNDSNVHVHTNVSIRFGHGGPNSWQGRLLKNFYRLQRCDTEDELKHCIAYVLQCLAGEQELGSTTDSRRREVTEFVLARLAKCDKWIRLFQLGICTRGVKASQRVEVDFSVMARRLRINARLSWATTANRLMRQQKIRHRERMRWITGQMTGTLFREPTNKADSTLTRQELKLLDRFLLPWALDCFEEQLLFASEPNVQVHYLGVDKGTHAFCCDRGHAGCLEEEDKDVAAAAHTSFATTRRQSDESSDDSSTCDEEHQESDGDGDPDAEADKAAEQHLESLGDTGDAQHFKSHFKHLWDSQFDYNEPVAPGTAFMYKKVQHVLFKPSTQDATKCTVSCTCGFSTSHGVSCRHILAVLLKMLEANQPVDLWSNINLLDLFNMAIVSKHKYHAACFGLDFFLNADHHAFTINTSLVTQYCLHQSAVAAPASGLVTDDGPPCSLQSTLARITKPVTAPSRSSSRPHAMSNAQAHQLLDTMLSLAHTSEARDYLHTTFRSAIETLERLARNPHTQEDDQRKFGRYDHIMGRERTGRGGVPASHSGRGNMLQHVVHGTPLPTVSHTRPPTSPQPPQSSPSKKLAPASPVSTAMPSATSKKKEAGNPHFLSALRYQYRSNGPDHVSACKEYELAVQAGHQESHAKLAMLLLDGSAAVPKDADRAFAFAFAGAQLDCIHSIAALGACHLKGRGVVQNISKGFKLVKASAQKKSYLGLYLLGDCFRHGTGIKMDAVQAFENFKESADLGYDAAQYAVGASYFNGRGTRQDKKEALRWWGMAMTQSNVNAIAHLAFLHETGPPVMDRRNIKEAIRLYTLAAQQGHAVSQYNLGDSPTHTPPPPSLTHKITHTPHPTPHTPRPPPSPPSPPLFRYRLQRRNWCRKRRGPGPTLVGCSSGAGRC